ncbi:MAG: M20/M25/M40 family metallo-hydrolase [Acidobacteriota bacterium]|nr:M20/M25/M40 family metallo-hydrolase [Acidobacteriota bacterium]
MRLRTSLMMLLAATLMTWGALASWAQIQGAGDPLQRMSAPQGAGACTNDAASSCAEAAAKILPVVMGPSPMQENLRRLTDEIGGRVTGTPAMARAIRWGVEGFRAAGVDVHTEKYQLPLTWSEGDTRLELLGEIKFPLRAVSLGWSPATPPGGIEAAVVDIGNGTPEDFAAAGAQIKGAILLAHTDIGATWADLFNEYSRPPDIIDRAVNGGAAAILWVGARERLLLYRHTNTGDGQLEKIPQAVVAREDALRFSRMVLAYPGKIRVRFSMPNKIGPAVEQENVVGEIRGYEKPDEAVIVGAHLDSWDLGTGALDNGCNAALVIEAARALKATGLRPRRTIRFILFSGEEEGLLGSWAYVKSHRAELDKIQAVIVFDSGIGRVTGFSLGGRREIEAGVREALKPLDSWDVNHHTADAQMGTDHFDFMIEGVPTLVANQEEANYLPNYHAASDTLDKVDMRTLKLHTAIAALAAWGLADRAEALGKRLSREELETMMKETGLDQQMKAMGFWADWEKGTRGRQR